LNFSFGSLEHVFPCYVGPCHRGMAGPAVENG